MMRGRVALVSLIRLGRVTPWTTSTGTAVRSRTLHSTSAAWQQDDRAQSFSDAHFGQERDRERRRASRRGRESEDDEAESQGGTYSEADHEHAVISTFDLFSIGIGPSSSHTVGPMRAGKIFVTDLERASLLQHVSKIRISLYGSLAATGEGHMTPSALLLGLECADVETVETEYVPRRFEEIKSQSSLHLGLHSKDGPGRLIDFDYDKDLVWEWGKTLPLHSNGMRLTVFDEEGTMLATNDLFSVGGGFVVNGALSTASSARQTAEAHDAADLKAGVDVHPADLAENMFYKEIDRENAAFDRRAGVDVNSVSRLAERSGALPAPPPSSSNEGAPLPSRNATTPESRADVGSASSASSRAPPYPFRDAKSLIGLCKKHNLTIAQIVYENERAHGYTDDEIQTKLLSIWNVMDTSIHEGVKATDETLPGSLKLNRRAPALYRRLTRGLYPSLGEGAAGFSDKSLAQKQSPKEEKEDAHKSLSASTPNSLTVPPPSSQDLPMATHRRGPPRVHGSFHHPIMPSPARRTTFPAIDYLTVYAMAVNETNAAGGRIVTAPTNGAAGIIPAVLKYTLEFQSDDAERDVFTFLLTAAAIGMLYKRGATISAAEGGCMAEVGVACSMAAAAFAACMGARPETIEQAAEIGIEHNLGLTCDPIGGLVQAPCIERNALGAIKAIASANLALSSEGTHKVSLDEAIRAMRLTAQGMRNEFKETSLSGLATSVSLNIPVSVPDC